MECGALEDRENIGCGVTFAEQQEVIFPVLKSLNCDHYNFQMNNVILTASLPQINILFSY